MAAVIGCACLKFKLLPKTRDQFYNNLSVLPACDLGLFISLKFPLGKGGTLSGAFRLRSDLPGATSLPLPSRAQQKIFGMSRRTRKAYRSPRMMSSHATYPFKRIQIHSTFHRHRGALSLSFQRPGNASISSIFETWYICHMDPIPLNPNLFQ